MAGEQLGRHGVDVGVVHGREQLAAEHRRRLGVDLPREGVLLAEVALGSGNAPEHAAHLWLVDGEREGQAVPQSLCSLGAVAGEQVRRVGVEPATCFGEPPGGAAVEEGDRRRDPVSMAALDHPRVVVELRLGEVIPGGLDPRPLDGEAVAVEPDPGQELDVLPVAVVAVAGVTRALDEERGIQVLEEPEVRVDVVPLDLVRRRGRSPDETGGERALDRCARGHGRSPDVGQGMRPR